MVVTNQSIAHLWGVAHSLGPGRCGCGSRALPPTLRRLVACIVTVAAVWATTTQAQLINPDIWLQNPGSTVFGVPTNWNTGTVPAAGNEVLVDSTSTQFPVLSGGSYSTGPIYFSYDVGGSQPSSLTIQNGGSLTTSSDVQSEGVVLAVQSNTSTTVTVTGLGSQLTTSGSISVGNEGSGTLNILNGAQVQSQGVAVNIGFGLTGTGTSSALVTGAGSLLSVSGQLTVGNNAAGSLNVANQATVNVVGNAFVGELASGTLTISNQAAVTLGSLSSLILADQTGSQGVLNIGAPPGSAPIGPGTLTTGDIFFGNGTGVINFNHTATDYLFAPDIVGAGSINLFSGTTILAGDNSGYTGNINLNGGTAAVNNDGNLGTGALIFNGGTLEALSAGGGIVSSKLVTLNAGGGTFLADASTISTLSGTISGIGSFTMAGPGMLVLTAANNYSGGTNLNGGIVAVSNDGNLGTGALSFNGGTLEALTAGGGITSAKAVTLNSGGGTFLADAGTTSTLSGAINGIGSFTETGLGILVLAGVNNYSGATNRE